MADCACPVPDPDGRGRCTRCGKFACHYAGKGRVRCSSASCDCFIVGD